MPFRWCPATLAMLLAGGLPTAPAAADPGPWIDAILSGRDATELARLIRDAFNRELE